MLFNAQAISTNFNADPAFALPNGNKLNFIDSGSAYSLLAMNVDARQVTSAELEALDEWVQKGTVPGQTRTGHGVIPGQTRTGHALSAVLSAQQTRHAYSDLIHVRLLHP